MAKPGSGGTDPETIALIERYEASSFELIAMQLYANAVEDGATAWFDLTVADRNLWRGRGRDLVAEHQAAFQS